MRHNFEKLLAAALLLLMSGPLFAGLEEVAQLNAQGSYRQAMEALEKLPASPRSRLLQADALAGLQRSDEAESIYRALIEEQPQDPAPYNNLASLYAASGRLNEASEMLNRAMESDARYATVYRNLSRIYVELSRNAYASALRMDKTPGGLQLSRLDYAEKVSAVNTVAQASVPAPEPAAPTPAAQGEAAAVVDNGADAVVALKVWANAWSVQDVEAYLAAYDESFIPPREMSLAQWRESRRHRLAKPQRIKVELDQYEVSSRGEGQVRVTLRQRYHSDRYSDVTRKGFELVARDSGWKILREYTIEVLK